MVRACRLGAGRPGLQAREYVTPRPASASTLDDLVPSLSPDASTSCPTALGDDPKQFCYAAHRVPVIRGRARGRYHRGALAHSVPAPGGSSDGHGLPDELEGRGW